MSRVLYYNSDGTPMSYLTQWDKNISLVVKGADVTSVPDFHFSNKNSKKALVVKSTIDGEDLYAQIPNALLQEGLPITVHIYYTSEDGSSRTKYSVTIHVVSRPEPNDYEYSDSGGNAELKDDIAALQALGLQVVDGKICQAYKEE